MRHHNDSDYRVSKLDNIYLNWHKVFRTDEYLKTLKLMNKKVNQGNTYGAAAPGPQGYFKPAKKHATILGSKQANLFN